MVLERVILLLGSNRGDRRHNLERATSLLAERAGRVIALSGIYESEPWGFEDDTPFLNRAVVLVTQLAPERLLEVTQGIESVLGREEHHERYAARTMDIDILFFGERVIATSRLQVPHPRLTERRFVLVPLAEIAGEMVHPVLGKSVRELLEACDDEGWVKPVAT